MVTPEIHDLARRLVDEYATRKRKVTTAESCTGGLIAGAITEIAGASQIFEGGFITYSNQAKSDFLGLDPALFETVGAVSPEVAEAMAAGAIKYSRADIAVSATGIAGPGGGSAAKSVGLVYIGIADREGHLFHYKCNFSGDRSDIRLQTVKEALKMLLTTLGE